MEGAGLDLVLSGHSHSYERSVLMRRHYGDNTTWNAARSVVRTLWLLSTITLSMLVPVPVLL